jgi:hypothetical protein
VVHALAVLADASSGDAVDHDVARHFEVDRDVERGAPEHTIQLARLDKRAREPVEHEPVAQRPTGDDAFLDDSDDDLVGHELPASMNRLASRPNAVPARGLRAEQVAGREVREAEVVSEARWLGCPCRHPACPTARGAASPAARSAQEPFVVAHHELAVELFHRLEHRRPR